MVVFARKGGIWDAIVKVRQKECETREPAAAILTRLTLRSKRAKLERGEGERHQVVTLR